MFFCGLCCLEEIQIEFGLGQFLMLNNISAVVGCLLQSFCAYFYSYEMFLIGRVLTGKSIKRSIFSQKNLGYGRYQSKFSVNGNKYYQKIDNTHEITL